MISLKITHLIFALLIIIIFADTLYGNEFGSYLWCRTSLLRMIWRTTNNQLVYWHFLATYTVTVLIETQVNVNCSQCP